MKLISLATLFASTSVILAEPAPKSYLLGRYQEMIDRSAFTDPVEPEPPSPTVNELPDWALVGVRKYQNEQFVTIMNIKDRSQRIEIPGSKADALGFSLLEVEVARSFLKTKVKVQKGRERRWLEYDPKLLHNRKVQQKAPVTENLKKNDQPPTPGKRVRYVPKSK